MKNVEIKELTDKVKRMLKRKMQQHVIINTVFQLNSLQAQQINISSSVQKNELEQVKRDKSIATGLINTMQKDLTTKVLVYKQFRIRKR